MRLTSVILFLFVQQFKGSQSQSHQSHQVQVENKRTTLFEGTLSFNKRQLYFYSIVTVLSHFEHVNLVSETSSYKGLLITSLHLPEEELHRLPWKLNISENQNTWFDKHGLHCFRRQELVCLLGVNLVMETLALHITFQHDYPIFNINNSYTCQPITIKTEKLKLYLTSEARQRQSQNNLSSYMSGLKKTQPFRTDDRNVFRIKYQLDYD